MIISGGVDRDIDVVAVADDDNDNSNHIDSTVGAETASQEGNEDADTQRLALQCCELGFVDPDFVTVVDRKGREEVKGIQSNRRNFYRLDEVWWSSCIGALDGNNAYGGDDST